MDKFKDWTFCYRLVMCVLDEFLEDDIEDDKRSRPLSRLPVIHCRAENFANLILSDSLTLIKLHDLHAHHSLAVLRSEKYLLGS